MEGIKEFDWQKVDLFFTNENYFGSSLNKKSGKIKIVDDRIRFYEGRKTARFFYLDAGLYEDFFTTLIPIKIVPQYEQEESEPDYDKDIPLENSPKLNNMKMPSSFEYAKEVIKNNPSLFQDTSE